MKRTIAPVIRKARLGEIDEQAERRAHWAAQPMAARIAEVEVLRRMWIELTGDPDLPMQLVVHKRRLGEPAPLPPAPSPSTPLRRPQGPAGSTSLEAQPSELVDILPEMLGTSEVVQQEHSEWCWAAVVQMVRRHFEMEERRQCEIVGARWKRHCCQEPLPSGCNIRHPWHTFNDLLRSEGIRCRVDQPPGALDERALGDELYSDRPVVIGWIWGQNRGGHYVLVFMRPYRGKKKPHKMYYRVADPLEGLKAYPYERLQSPHASSGVAGTWSWTWYNLEVP